MVGCDDVVLPSTFVSVPGDTLFILEDETANFPSLFRSVFK